MVASEIRPPMLPSLLLRLCLPKGVVRDSILGDFWEGYRTRRLSGSPVAAHLWYWRQSLALSGRSIVRRLSRRQLDLGRRSDRRNPRRSWVEVGGSSLMGDLHRNLCFALRVFKRHPGTTLVIVLTLGLGVGGTTAIFSVVDGVILEELPYERPERLVSIWKAHPSWRQGDTFNPLWDQIQFTHRDFLDLKQSATLLDGIGLYAGWGSMALTGSGQPEQLSVGLASANLFDVIGVHPQLGRSFRPDESSESPGGARRVVILSEELWKRRFGEDTGVVGQSLTLDGKLFTIVGVLPSGFRLESVIVAAVFKGVPDMGLRDIWIPLGQEGTDLDAEGNSFEVLARLREGATPDQARTEVQMLLRSSGREPVDQEARLAVRKEMVTEGFSTPLLLILGASGILLAIVCANVATLILGEANGRCREMAVRSALGAGKLRISGQLLTENCLLGLAGGGLGVLIALGATRALVGLAPPIPRLEQVGVSLPVLLFGLALGLSSGLLSGLAPVMLLGRNPDGTELKGTKGSAGKRSHIFQSGILGTQIALTVVLLVVGGLLGRSLLNLLSVDPGFETRNLATFRLQLPESRYARMAEATLFFERSVEAMEQVAGVSSASGSYGLPFPGGAPMNSVFVENRGEGVGFTARRRTVLPDYHRTLGIPILQGRPLSRQDTLDRPGAMLLSESLARRHWAEGSPIGETVAFWGKQWSIVGIVGDVKHTSLASDGEPTFYVPLAQAPRRNLTLFARTSSDPASMIPLLQEAVWTIDGDLPVTESRTMTSLVSESAAQPRFRTLLVLLFASLATVLATMGVSAVTVRSIVQRHRDLGIRLALGAQRSQLYKLVLRQVVTAGLIGIATGLGGAFWASRLLSSFAFGVDPGDPGTYLAVTLLLILICALAACLPCRRISRIDPACALRTP